MNSNDGKKLRWAATLNPGGFRGLFFTRRKIKVVILVTGAVLCAVTLLSPPHSAPGGAINTVLWIGRFVGIVAAVAISLAVTFLR